MSSSVRIPPPTVSGMKQTSAVLRTTSQRISRPWWLAVMSRKTSSSAPLVLVTGRDGDRVARVAEVDEVRPLDDPAFVDVQARDDPLGEHHACDPWIEVQEYSGLRTEYPILIGEARPILEGRVMLTVPFPGGSKVPHVLDALPSGKAGSRVQECPPVGLGQDAGVEDRDDPPVVFRDRISPGSSNSLLELDDRLEGPVSCPIER